MHIIRLLRFFSVSFLFMLYPSLCGAGQDGTKAAEARLAIVPEGYTIGQVAFSPDKGKVAFSAGEKGKWHLFEGDQKSKPYDSVKMIAFSPDGKRVVYSAGKGAKEILVVDGKEIKSYDWVCNPVFSPDSRMVAYEAREGKKFFVVVDGKESPRYDMSLVQPAFSPDSRQVFYVLLDQEKKSSISFVSDTRSGKVIKTTTYDTISGVVFSHNGSMYAYVASRGEQQFVVVGRFTEPGGREREGPAFDSVSDVIFSPDGTLIAFVVEKQGKQFMVLSNAELMRQRQFSAHDRIWQSRFSPDGKHILYGAQSGREVWLRVEPAEFE